MSSNKMATKSDLQEMYSRILPYLGGSADAGFTPIGTIIAVFSETAPANYLICDGATYNKADYPELAAHLLALTTHSQYEVDGDSNKFKVPDLRGEFLRGTGTNSHANQGNGSNVGVHQDGTEHSNGYQFGTTHGLFLYGNATNTYNSRTQNIDSTTRAETHYSSSSCNVNAQAGGSALYTSRPTNTSVLYCIATKNIYLNPENDYSTDEKVIGTWIDGRTLFQRTFAIPSTSLVADQVQNITIAENLNIDEIVSFDGMVKSGGSATNFVSFNYNNQYWYRPLLYSQTLRLDAVSHVATTIYGYLTIKYVKSTS